MVNVSNASDRAWKVLGETDPYFAVLTEPEYHRDRMSAEARERFFRSGEEHLDRVVAIIREKLDPGFSPARSLDFGCGVGRILIPLSRTCPDVTGVDVSGAMLCEAKRNIAEAGVSPARLAISDDALANVSGTFEFIHSYIVLQHIPIKRGERIIRELVARLAPGGCAMLHVTYSHRMRPINRLLYWTRVNVPGAHSLLNLALGRKLSAPLMQGNDYSLTEVVDAIRGGGCPEVYLRFSEHDGAQGALIFFKKSELDPF